MTFWGFLIVKLVAEFFLRDNVVEISRDLLGKVLCTRIDGQLTQAIITETEAYAGIADRASHAYGDRRTKRTEPMYRSGGIAYVYLCYGIHHLFNVVTNVAGTPHAVLIRAGEPLVGIDTMLMRRNKTHLDRNLLAGPGSTAQALGITVVLTGISLLGSKIWIEDQQIAVPDSKVSVGPRIGVDYAAEDTLRPYRFKAMI